MLVREVIIFMIEIESFPLNRERERKIDTHTYTQRQTERQIDR